MNKYIGLTQKLSELNDKNPSLSLCYFYNPEKKLFEATSVEQIYRRALGYAQELVKLNAYQKPVLILHEPGVDYICALMGCFYAQAIAVPSYPPVNEEMADNLLKIIENCQANIVLVSNNVKKKMKIMSSLHPIFNIVNAITKQHKLYHRSNISKWISKISIISSDDIGEVNHCETLPKYDEKNIAYLQYTSGSTSHPKGVIISYENLITNLMQIHHKHQFTEEDKVVSWLPPYHDMGLITSIFVPLYFNFQTMHLSPVDFIRNPSLWLESMSRYKATISGGPDFAFRLCIKKLKREAIEQLDLSNLRIVFCGAEKINPETFDHFYDLLQPSKMNYNIYVPCYGLAEAVVYISSKNEHQRHYATYFDKTLLPQGYAVAVSPNHPSAIKIVSVGSITPGTYVSIVDVNTKEILPEGRIGEIHFCGPNKALGYFNDKEKTNEVFYVKLNNQYYLKTGDLGFIYDGELYISGRIKDIVIIHGRNYDPASIEEVVYGHEPLVKPGGVVLFSSSLVEDELIMMVEVDSEKLNFESLAKVIRTLVGKSYSLTIQEIVFVPKKTILKTTSGKVKHQACKQLYEDRKINKIYYTSKLRELQHVSTNK